MSLKCSCVHIEMNYEKFKRSDRPDRFHRTSLTLLSTIFSPFLGEKFFNDYLRIDTKKFPISVFKMKFVHVHFAAD